MLLFYFLYSVISSEEFFIQDDFLHDATRLGDTSPEYAHYKCKGFYDQRREGDYGVNVEQAGEGGQGVVYKCSTNDPNSDLPLVSLKLYRYALGVCMNGNFVTE